MTGELPRLAPVMEELSARATILPATGQALTDEMRPDIEAAYDRAIGGEAEPVGIWETTPTLLYREVQETSRPQDHRFKFFLDGSTKTYFIGTLLEQNRSSPVQVAQVGAAAVQRDDKGQLRTAGLVHQLAVFVDGSELSGDLWHAVQEAGKKSDILVKSTHETDDYTAVGGTEPRARGAHKANWLMREAEHQIALEGLPERSDVDWLVCDGSLGNEFLNWRGPPLVGVAKTFRRDSLFIVGEGPRAKTLNLYGLLAGLDKGHRTAVFPRQREGRSQLIAFWYVRLRPQSHLDYPLMGVVKVEIPCPSGELVDSDLADQISGCLVAERNVTPHGQDSRWHAHLYPVWVAERVIRNSFHSDEVLKAAIRWPKLTGATTA